MTPKTQSVCKHCGQSIHLLNGYWRAVVIGKKNTRYCEDHDGRHEPVAEPSSTGEPRSAYQELTLNRSKCLPSCYEDDISSSNSWTVHVEGCPNTHPAEPAAPQASAELFKCDCNKCRLARGAHPFFNGRNDVCTAAPQDAPDSATFGSVTCSNTAEPLIEPDQPSPMIFAPKLAGDAPKVEEIARKLHLYHCQERRSGSICPCHVIAEGMSEGCHCKEETADIASILHPYFPPASQKIIGLARDFLIATGQFTPFDPNATYAVTGQQIVHIINQFVAQLNIADRVVATPASTARTDGWVSVPHDLLMELRGVVVGEWNFVPLESDKAKYLHTLWTQIDAIRLHAALGSVPPLCNDPDCGDGYDKREALEHAQNGVPQAEPPKKEKP